MVTIVRRHEMPEINEALVDGKRHLLGVLKDFRWHEAFARFLPRDAKLSLSWVHLEPGQVLDAHVHPVASMILVCEGDVETLGEVQQPMTAGDALLVPAGHRHGFRGAGARGFWGLSVQFDDAALYTDVTNPRVRFETSGASDASNGLLEELLVRNRVHLKEFADNPLFVLARSGKLSHEDGTLAAFLDHFQVWSRAFQRMVLARAAFSSAAGHRAVATKHLEEELGHDALLAQARGDRAVEVDPIVDATCEWFVAKMMSLDDAERTVLVHLVVEASAEVFYAHIGPLAKKARLAESHFAEHAGSADEDHVALGLGVLRRSAVRDAAPLLEIQRRGWEMLGTMFARIAHLVSDGRPAGARAPAGAGAAVAAPRPKHAREEGQWADG